MRKEEWWCNNMDRLQPTHRRSGENGQTTALMLILLSLFLLGFLGFATDYSQVWAHRQTAQAAADSACQAGAADLLLDYENASGASSDYGLNFSWVGTSFSCSASSASNPVCSYAAANGYSGSSVSATFPSSVSGVSLPSGYGTIPYPYIKVTVTDAVPLTFSRAFQSTSTVSVAASATCGMAGANVPIPLVILNKTLSGSLTL